MSEETKASSPKQPLLETYLSTIAEQVSDKAVIEGYINEANNHLPTLIIAKEFWHQVAELLKNDDSFKYDYLMNLSGVDYESKMEVVYHLYSYSRDEFIAIKVETDRDGGSVNTVMDIWLGADWQERETYDLLGINFTGREISRILLPDDWTGYPLRKDYKPYDEEV